MNETTTSIQVLDRAVQLLEAVATTSVPATLKIVSAETGLHPSTAHRILNALAAHGLVARGDDGAWHLGRRLRDLATHVEAEVDLREEARPIMEALRNALGETVNLTVREGDEVVYIDRVISTRMIRVEQVIGSRAPLHVTAVGKLMLGEAGDRAIDAYAERTGLPSYTKKTLATADRLKADIRRSVKRGYALDNEEAEPGVGCIGVLIRDGSGRAVGGLSISAPIERRRSEWVERVKDAGLSLSRRLGFSGS
jgi:DNA-binding IclR family transcriptional regulator